jgi:hypothetical protein
LNKDFLLLPEVFANVLENLPSASGVGRPQTLFKQSSERTKRRKTQQLRKEHKTEA